MLNDFNPDNNLIDKRSYFVMTAYGELIKTGSIERAYMEKEGKGVVIKLETLMRGSEELVTRYLSGEFASYDEAIERMKIILFPALKEA